MRKSRDKSKPTQSDLVFDIIVKQSHFLRAYFERACNGHVFKKVLKKTKFVRQFLKKFFSC